MTKENKNENLNNQESNIDEGKGSSDGTQNTDKNEEVDNRTIPYARFKEKVDEANALKEKLAEFEKAQKEAERKKLEEQNEYKKLYEQAQEQAEKFKQEALEIKKGALLAQAGYGEDQAKLLVKLIEGETDEEISESIKLLKTTLPAQDNYGDPNAFNGAKEKPKTAGADEVGVSLFENVKNKIF